MPLISGVSSGGGDLPRDLQQPIYKFYKHIDKAVAKIARLRGLSPYQVRLLKPCSFCTLVSDDAIFVVLTDVNVGGLPSHFFIDWRGRPMNLVTALSIVERDVLFEQTFGFSFPRNYLETSSDKHQKIAENIADNYIKDEILRLEKLKRIVRMNPLFHGRDFMLDTNSIFVLCPFEEPFNIIYNDHIKPTVEQIQGLTCNRADDIYDNRPIIEDIWKKINEASIIISELTGRNPNVFYETGIAHTVGKEVVLITQYMDDVPFDLKHLRCVVYNYTPRGVQLLETNLTNTINNIRQRVNN